MDHHRHRVMISSCKESSWHGHGHGQCPPPSPAHAARCLCLYAFLSVLILVVVPAAVLLAVFATRLKKPTFFLQSVQMDSRSFSLRTSNNSGSGGGGGNGTSSSSSCTVASLVFAARNPNAIGIRYGAADLGVAYANESVGAMDVPLFYQPPRSSNVTVLMRAVFEQSDLSRLVVAELSSERTRVEIRIAGSIQATTHLMNFPLPKLQFSIDCRIATNYTDIVVREGIKSATSTRKALQASAPSHITQECSLKLEFRRSRVKGTKLADLRC